MKKFSLIAAALMVASSSAFAQVNTTFDVKIDFTATCQVKTAASNLEFQYEAFAAAPAPKSTTPVFRCTRGLNPTFSLDSTGPDQTGSANVALGTAVTGQGVISGVRYTLSGVSSRSQTGAAAAAGAAGTIGTPDEYSVVITANIPGGQAGEGASAIGTHTRVLTITY